MTKKYSLGVKTRTQEKPVKLRQQGQVPAVIYGHGFKNINLSVDALKLEKAYEQVGESNLFDLIIDDQQPVKVVIKNVARDPVSGRIIHIDFYKVKMDEKITVEVPLEFVNESRAIKDLGGILVKNLDSLEIECLPGDLVSEIEVDLSKLHELGDMIRVGDLKIPDSVSVQHEPESMIVLAEEPSKLEEKEIQAGQPKEEEEAKETSEQDAVEPEKQDDKELDKNE